MVQNWKKTVPDLDCVIDDNFCQSLKPCDQVSQNISSFSVTLGDQVFEMKPDLFLHQTVEDSGSRCQFAIHENEMHGSSGDLMVIGDLLLRHLYQVYDFENETISLGLDKHSQNELLIYDEGQRPESAEKLQVVASNVMEMDPIIAQRFNE